MEKEREEKGGCKGALGVVVVVVVVVVDGGEGGGGSKEVGKEGGGVKQWDYNKHKQYSLTMQSAEHIGCEILTKPSPTVSLR